MNSDQKHPCTRQDVIEQLVRDYGFEEILEGLTDYAQTQAIATSGQMSEYWYDMLESLQHIQDG